MARKKKVEYEVQITVRIEAGCTLIIRAADEDDAMTQAEALIADGVFEMQPLALVEKAEKAGVELGDIDQSAEVDEVNEVQS